VILKFRHLAFSLLIAALVLSCKSAPARVVDSPEQQTENIEERNPAGGLADEIRALVETGRLTSMIQAMELIRSRDLGGSDFGRMMNGLITVIAKLVYPDSTIRFPAVDLPQTSSYARIIREAERGNYIRPAPNSTDFFEYILPFLVVNNDTRADILNNVLIDLLRAGEMRPQSVLPPYFRGLIFERIGRYTEAETSYRNAYGVSNDFYPSSMSIARIMSRTGRRAEAASILQDLVISYPDSLDIKRQLAVTYYENADWSRAAPFVDEILQHNNRDGTFLLMRAHIHIEMGNYSQANAPLDAYASINPNNRFYLFLRARLQAEGNRNRDSALNYLRSIIRANPNDEEAVLYAARLLMESQRPADQAEGRELLGRLPQGSASSVDVLSLSLRDAIQRENWREAQGYLNRILAVRRTDQDLTDAYNVEKGLGNNARALTFARELYERNNSNNEYIVIYIAALIDNGRREEASRLLEGRLSSLGAGTQRSQFYFLRSRIQNNEETALSDLRSSLFEDPRNLDALIAMFEIYHRRREERRAVHYLRQALAISPDNPRLKRYENEYSSLLGR
jgi:tetratricopeptide (TPR) repeat protein